MPMEMQNHDFKWNNRLFEMPIDHCIMHIHCIMKQQKNVMSTVLVILYLA